MSVAELRDVILRCASEIGKRNADPFIISQIASDVFSIGRPRREQAGVS
jgi:hypothetical protein